MWAVLCLCLAASSAVLAAPHPQDAAPSKSAFVPAFDEIVVESSLTVRGRSSPTNTNSALRQGRTKLLVVPTPGTPLDSAAVSPVTGTNSTGTTATVQALRS